MRWESAVPAKNFCFRSCRGESTSSNLAAVIFAVDSAVGTVLCLEEVVLVGVMS